MKIGLNMGERLSLQSQPSKVSEGELLAAQRGDWVAIASIERAFTPLLASLTQKRTTDPAKADVYLEAGKRGLARAVKKYTPKVGAARFPIFMTEFIQEAMDSTEKPGKGFFARLFSGQ